MCTIKDAIFNIACAWNSVKANILRLAWRKLWPAVMIAEGALHEEDFTGFNVHNKDAVHEMVMIFEKLDP
jgi:hypothetical protein